MIVLVGIVLLVSIFIVLWIDKVFVFLNEMVEVVIFLDEVLGNNKFILVEFYVNWCMIC